MNIDRITKAYLAQLQQKVKAAGGSAASALELATRPVVTKFLDDALTALKPGSVLHHESQVGSDKPDWRIEDPETFGVYAYADHKGLALNGPLVLDSRSEEQVQRYLALGRPVFVFDGVEFLFFKSGSGDPERLTLVEKPLDLDFDWTRLTINPAVKTRLGELLESPGFHKWTEADLMVQLAGRARLLSSAVLTLLEAPCGSGSDAAEEELLGALHDLHELARKNHDPALTDPQSCADFIAQVLVFGLFYAHANAPSDEAPAERRKRIEAFWDSSAYSELAARLRPFRTIVNALGDTLKSRNDLRVWYDEATLVLAHAEYMGTEIGPIDFHTLFERFFEAFDKQTRFDRGVFYTPAAVTEWMTRVTEKLLHLYFSGGIVETVETLIDPCCGTGGFLDAAINYVGDVKGGPHYIGFEVLPAPYALAQYRLSKVGQDWANQPDISIALTDTLSDRMEDPPARGLDGFSDELADASDWARPPVRVVIGNPPSSIHTFSAAPRTRIEKLMEEFRPPLDERRIRQNTQQALSNEAYRFLRWSSSEVLRSGTGIVALVLPGAFANAVSYKYARKWLINSFDALYVLMLDQDIRSGQAHGQSMFQVQQGRLILFAVRTSTQGRTADENTGVFVHDVAALSRAEKEEFLEARLLEVFTQIQVASPNWRFQPLIDDSSEIWQECWPLRGNAEAVGIFRSKCSGVKLAPTSVLFHTDMSILERRSRDLAARTGRNWSKTAEKLLEDWWKGRRRPPSVTKLTDSVREAVGTAAKGGAAISPYTFRPFVDGFVLDDEKLFKALEDTPGSGTRARPEIRAAFAQGARGIALAQAPVDLGSSLTRIASFCWQLPDNDIVARGNAMIFTDLYPAEKRGEEWDSTVFDNITPEFLGLFEDGRTALFYVYAVLSSRIYLETFAASLYQPSDPDNPARVPVAANKELRARIAELGGKLAECERPGVTAHDAGFKTTWAADRTELRVERISLDASEGIITLIGPGGDSVKITDVPSDVLRLRISGHDVVEKWLRERTFVYLRRSFMKKDLEEIIDVLSRISRQFDLLEEVTELLEEVLATNDIIPPLTA
ncbi:type ISP restriction/modification enzyme [Mycobacterium novum]